MTDKNDNKSADKSINNNFKHSDIIIGLLTSFTSCAFLSVVLALCVMTGSIDVNMDNAVWFILFAFVTAVGSGFLVFMGFAKNLRGEIGAISDALDKICKGQYDVRLPELSDKYKKIGKNITKLAEYMKQAENSSTDFMNDFSHELKTPIVSIRGFAKLLAKGNLSEAERKEYLNVIIVESDRLIDLTAGTLLLDRLDNNRLEIEEKLYNVSEQLRRCILMLQDSWEKKNISINADFQEYFIVSNEELISQLFLNILQNAIKFTENGGKVDVKIEETDKSTTVLIADNGIGMDANTKKRMFDKYFRGDKSRSTPGNGLGLATVKKIAEVTKTTLKVDSEENLGTRFYVIFKK